jgi:formiminotetrahydrofolate cyclodeaminase
MLVDQTVRELLDAFSSASPTPGGGSAAALAGAVAASLLAMVAGMPKTKSGAPEERQALDALLPELLALRERLTGLVDRDAASYDAVVAAYRLPKASDDDKSARKAAIAAAMRGATEVPLETARAIAAVLGHGRAVATAGNAHAASDAGVALSLAMSAYSGAWMNVETNLASIADPSYVAAVREEFARLNQQCALAIAPAFEALGWKGHTPPAAPTAPD